MAIENGASTPTHEKQDRLVSYLRSLGSCAVAMSGGVDSVVVAKAAYLALGAKAIAVTGVSPSLAEGELEWAEQAARSIGIAHRVMPTEEYKQEAYQRNARDRCYHCKSELYSKLAEIQNTLHVAYLANGSNVDDLGDYRPGMQAATERRVVSPLIECGLRKADVREIAAAWELSVWDKPASPCLASRVAYGEEVTPRRLAMIDQAEQLLRSLGLREVRVRYHKDDLARLEVPAAEIARMADQEIRVQIVARLRALGFRYIALDLEGFRSGSLNLVSLGD